MNKIPYKKNAIVIGAGIAGISAAIRLAVKGYKVQVFEANAYAGGKLSEISGNGYRFDAGPSLFTMPHYVDELFRIADKKPEEHFSYKKLDLLCKYFYEDGLVLNAYANNQKFAEEVAQKTEENKENILRFLRKSRKKYELTAEVFLHNSLHKLKNYFTKSTVKGILNFYQLDTFTTMNQVNENAFKDPRLVQFFNRYATYNGSDPYQTPGTMNIVPHLEFGIGAFFPKGGMYNITKSLVKLAEELGVKFYYNKLIEEILVEKNEAMGIRIGKKIYPAEVVVSNMDIVGTYNKLLPSEKAPKKLLNQAKSSSALIFYWGIKKSFPKLELHNILFSKNYKAEFDALFKEKTLYADPTVYINISSKENPEDAPESCENWFTMINAPNNSGQDWDKLIDEAKENIIKKINRLLKTDIRPLIEFEEILDPRTIESKTSSAQGALYGNSSNNRYAAFLRHANFSNKIKNLYFCGGSVHPGGGIPLALLSGKIATDLVKL